jgi:hypothetical protein
MNSQPTELSVCALKVETYEGILDGLLALIAKRLRFDAVQLLQDFQTRADQTKAKIILQLPSGSLSNQDQAKIVGEILESLQDTLKKHLAGTS